MTNRWPGDANAEVTTFAKLRRGQLMARVRSTENKTTELRLLALLQGARLAGWRRHQRLPGRPDFAWPKERVAVFVDGCFWHGHTCGKNVTPRTNADAWQEKIERNRARDRCVATLLRSKGWTVVRLWECQLSRRPYHCIVRIRRVLDTSRGTASAKLRSQEFAAPGA